MYPKLKQIIMSKTTHYTTQLNAFKNHSKETWNLQEKRDFKNTDKSGIPVHFKTNNYIITYPDQISNVLYHIFTNVGPEYAKRYLNVKSNLQHVFKIAMNKIQIVFL